MLNKQSRIADKGWSSTWHFGWGLTTSHRKKISMWNYTGPWIWTDSMERPWLRNIRPETWNLECQESL